MKSFKDYLDEAKQVGIVYHFTKFENLENILKSGAINSRYGFISTTRNYNLPNDLNQKDFDLSISRGYGVRFTLDGNKLSSRYKVSPILGTTVDVLDPQNYDYNSHRVSRHEHENEEMIKAKSISIDDYVLRIDIIPKNIQQSEIAKELKHKSIPIFVNRKFQNISEDVSNLHYHIS